MNTFELYILLYIYDGIFTIYVHSNRIDVVRVVMECAHNRAQNHVHHVLH